MRQKVLGIYAANAFGSVFLLASRINHSCIPNIHFAYNPELKKETFHAVRDIASGEELTIMYIDAHNMKVSTGTLYTKLLQVAQEMAAIQEPEELVHRQLGISYHDAVRYSLKPDNTKMALMLAKKELEVDLYCVGEDHPDYKKGLEVMGLLKAAAEGSEPIPDSVTKWYELQDPHCIVM
ncbi:hypothetical protein BJX76DRAFT_361620 [Aspergillus varians]